MKIKDILKVLDSFAKPELIDSWDNCGFQIGNMDGDVNRVLLSLDLDEKVLCKAIQEDYQMVITHHPLIFNPIKTLTSNTYTEQLIINAIKNDIAIYSAHSNLDMAIGGVNDELAVLLGIKDATILTEVIEVDGGDSFGYGRIGDIEEISTLDFLDNIKKSISIETLTAYGDLDKNISRVAVCGGSGAEFIQDAYKKGAQLYLTGDIKYHEAQLGQQLGIIIVDGGHYNTEKIILPVIKRLLDKEFKEEITVDIHNESSVMKLLH